MILMKINYLSNLYYSFVKNYQNFPPVPLLVFKEKSHLLLFVRIVIKYANQCEYLNFNEPTKIRQCLVIRQSIKGQVIS